MEIHYILFSFNNRGNLLQDIEQKMELNACIKWDNSPFHDLCVISLMLPLSQAALCKTKFNLFNHPECFSFPNPVNLF